MLSKFHEGQQWGSANTDSAESHVAFRSAIIEDGLESCMLRERQQDEQVSTLGNGYIDCQYGDMEFCRSRTIPYRALATKDPLATESEDCGLQSRQIVSTNLGSRTRLWRGLTPP